MRQKFALHLKPAEAKKMGGLKCAHIIGRLVTGEYKKQNVIAVAQHADETIEKKRGHYCMSAPEMT